MNKLYKILPFCLLILLSSCGLYNTPEKPFEKNGVSFTCPAGWKITDEEPLEMEGGYSLSIERQGLDESAIVTMTWLDGIIDKDMWLELTKEELSNNVIFDAAGVDFSPLKDTTFNNIPASSMKYSASLLGVKHEGIFMAIYQNGKTICIQKQEALEDHEKNLEGFDLIEKSFQVKIAEPEEEIQESDSLFQEEL